VLIQCRTYQKLKTQGTPPAAKPAAPAKPAPRDPSKTAPAVASKVKGDETLLTSRRRVVWSCVIGYLGANFLMFLRYFFPRALFEPKTVFKIGYPSDFSLGVDTKFQKDHRIWVVKTASRLFVIYARCVHLGCTPDWKSSENKFNAPATAAATTRKASTSKVPRHGPWIAAEYPLILPARSSSIRTSCSSGPKAARTSSNKPTHI